MFEFFLHSSNGIVVWCKIGSSFECIQSKGILILSITYLLFDILKIYIL